ncbi:DMT family transporter [[Clostridium] fimetarium]|uniref:Permease of the drug/metabolite transporter (DMT) superfamily n=1 Tax=[Clostridium] fimetarium TaxID=99656 RepID=A0A1I0MHG0_9FIRM|nr:DMT family transporter [[Clostridium] fimetarium]SEV87236.1 Permease of the drug/metabolite transporter (DMT) superfamily [[Clostridium] fimetarium]
MKSKKGELILLLASILWGSCFVFQKMGMDYIGPFTLGAFRFLLGAMTLVPVMVLLDRMKKRKEIYKGFKDKELYIGGGLCGTALFAAASLQQIGLQYTTAGKAGFITSLEIVLVAAIFIFITRSVQINVLIGVSLAVIGMYLLCMVEGFYLDKGDTYELIGVVFWAIQILAIDQYSKKVDVIKLSFVQFMTTGILSCVFMFVFENPQWNDIVSGAVPILYTAIIEVAVAYTLQIIGQRDTRPDIASVILSLESVFAVISGVLILGEIITFREFLGCVFMLAAIIVTQLTKPNKQQKCEKLKQDLTL